MSAAFEPHPASIPAPRLESLLPPEEKLIVRLAAGRFDPESFRGADWPALAETAARLGLLGHTAMREEN